MTNEVAGENRETNAKPSPDALATQLAELNNRARWYSTQLWTVSFAYLGISAVAITGFLKDAKEYLWIVLLACALFGFFVVRHMEGVRDGERRAVENIQRVEALLHIPVTAESKGYTVPFRVAVWIFIALFAIAGIFLACRQFR